MLFGRQSGAFGQVGAEGVQGATGQAEPRVQRAFHTHIKPGFDAARDELVRHGVDQHPRHQGHQGEDARQFQQQLAAELAPPQAQRQPPQGEDDDQAEQGSHGNVAPPQPAEVGLEALLVLGGQHQQKAQHQAAAQQGNAGDDPGPAVELDGAHGAQSCRLICRSSDRSQVFWLPRPICRGRGSSRASRRKPNST